MYSEIETVCLFIGYGRSGHSLVGSLLDAHENALIAHELHILRLITQGKNQHEIYQAIVNFADESRQRRKNWMGYSYEIKNSWQGAFRQLRVIGDKKGAGTNVFIMNDPTLIARLIETFGERLKFIHVIRNPYDNIASIYTTFEKNKARPFDEIIANYFDKASNVKRVKADGRIPVYDVHLEHLIARPGRTLERLCAFLSLTCSEDFLARCVEVIFKEPRPARFDVAWSEAQLAYVAQQIGRFDFLKGYTYDRLDFVPADGSPE